MSEFAEWLAQSPLNNSLEPAGFWIIPLMQIIHILSIAVVISSMIMVNLRIVRPTAINHTLPGTAARFLPWMWIALVILLLSGSTLVLLEPTRTLGKGIFWIKMAAILVAAGMTAAFHRDVLRRPAVWTEAAVRPPVAWFASVNLVLWVFIIIVGRWIAYV